MTARNTADNFWRKVNVAGEEQCWEWQGARNSSGYGNLSWQGQQAQAHRVAYFLKYGGIELQTNFRQKDVAKNYKGFVLHKCDNRLCCNPSHLFLGSMRTNQLDAYQKGRKQQPKSEHTNSKLTPAQVVEIRRRYDAGLDLQVPLAKEFGVSQRVISLVVRRETYKDVPWK
jgi:hypothetical protein